MIIYINNTLAYLHNHDPERLQKITEEGQMKEVNGLLYLIIKEEK